MIGPGDLLIAAVGLEAGWFHQTVVYVVDHDETGTLGVVLNRFAEPRLSSVLPQWADLVSEPQVLFSGGPVSPDGAICLAAVIGEQQPDGFRAVSGPIGLLHLDTSAEIAVGHYSDLRVFAGYAGWEAGQLASELARDMWWVARAEYRDVFTDHPEDLWRRCLRRQPAEIAWYSTWPDDPDQN